MIRQSTGFPSKNPELKKKLGVPKIPLFSCNYTVHTTVNPIKFGTNATKIVHNYYKIYTKMKQK